MRSILGLMLLAFALVPSALFAASTVIVTAEADLFVFEGDPDGNASPHGLAAGRGRGPKEGAMITYLRFDLTAIPHSTYFSNTSVDRAMLSLFAQSSGLASADDRFFVSVARCSVDAWVEDRMTWNTRVCKTLEQADDMVIVDSASLPYLVRWDVTRSVGRAAQEGRKLTFAVTAFKIPRVVAGAREIVPGEKFGPEMDVGFVRFWSRERIALSSRAVPTLTIAYSQPDTRLVQFVGSVLAILSAISLLLGLWGVAKRIWRSEDRH
jgi:hypothetical protein